MKLVFATHNPHKFEEVKAMMPAHIELVSLTDIGCHDDIPETADTIEGNASLKAQYVTKHFGLDCFADDTGLEIDALDGAPGVYSARYAGPEKDAQANMNLVLENLRDATNRSARFKTVIALIEGAAELQFPGICEGAIIDGPRGDGGFGYDPIFQPSGYEQTFAEISSEEKATIGHRGKAIRALIAYLSK